MANENGNQDNGNFFLGAIFAAVIFFLLFFSTRLRSALGMGADSGAGAGATASGGAGTGAGAGAGSCVKICDECSGALEPTPFAYKPTPPAFQGGFTSVGGTSNTSPMFGALGQIVDPFGGVTH